MALSKRMAHHRLTHYMLWHRKVASLSKAIQYRGPARNLLDGRYPDGFVDSVTFQRTGKHHEVWLRDDVHDLMETRHQLIALRSGKISLQWAAALKRCCDTLYQEWLRWQPDITDEPPATCPNKGAHAAYEFYPEEVILVPDDGNWICLGCGWTLDNSGNRVRVRYNTTDSGPRAGNKKVTKAHD